MLKQKTAFPFNFQQRTQLQQHDQSIRIIAISSDDKMMATGSYEGLIFLWGLTSFRSIKKLYEEKKLEILDLAFSKNSKLLAAATNHFCENILLFNLDIPNQINSFRFSDYCDLVLRIVFTFDSNYLLSGDTNSRLNVWDLQTQQIINSKSLSSSVSEICVSSNQRFIASGCDNGYVSLFSSITKLHQFYKWSVGDNCTSINFHHTKFTSDSKTIIIGCQNMIKIWSIGSSIKIMKVFDPKASFQIQFNYPIIYILRVNIVMDGSNLLFTIHNKVYFWNIQTSEIVIAINGEVGIFSNVKSQCATTQHLNYIILLCNNGKVSLYQRIR